MKKMLAIPLALSFALAKPAYSADEVHWTITGPNSVTINWHGDDSENSVAYGLPKGAGLKQNAQHPVPMPYAPKGTFWEAKLTGLKANTLYTYKIGNNPAYSFKTAPILGTANFTIIPQGTIGDSGHFSSVKAIQGLIANNKPNLVIGLGDLSLGSLVGQGAVHQHFNDVMAWSHYAAYMPVWGDRDVVNNDKDNIKNYKGRFNFPNPQVSPGSNLAGKDWYWLDYGNTRIITLPEPTQGAWDDWKNRAAGLMAQAQANSKIKSIVTFVHRPAYSSGHYSGSAALRTLLDSLGDSYTKYVLNVSSQSSIYERTSAQHGVVHVTAGSGGKNLIKDSSCLLLACAKPDWSAYRAIHLGALKLSFTETGINGAFICGPSGGTDDFKCSQGSIIDKFNIVYRTVTPANNQPVVAQSAVSMAAAPIALAATASAACTKVALPVSSLIKEGSYSYRINKSFGTPADISTAQSRSKLRLFENNVEIGPAHSGHNDIKTKGAGRFSHWNKVNGGDESLRFSATNNSNPKTNGKSYSYCISGASTPSVPTSDTQAPSVPGNMKATAASASQINLAWSASSDNKGVSGYKIYRNGTLLTTTSALSYNATGLASASTYSFYVVAYDAAGNISGKSTTVSAKTSIAVSAAPAPTACAASPTSSLVVNVQDKGARGNGSANDTAAIQAAVDQVAGTGGTVYVPNGTYMIDVYKRVLLKSKITFRMASGAVLKAIPTNLGSYNILRIQGVSNVNVIGGTIVGDRYSHSGSGGEHGHGLGIAGASNVVIEGVTAREGWGDGFYVGESSVNVAFCSVVADSNRRHGITITSANGVAVKNSISKNSNGFIYATGMDVEPNYGEYINNVRITNTQFINNRSAGFQSGYPYSSGGGVTNLVVDGNNISNNGTPGENYYSGLVLSHVNGAKILNNTVKNNAKDGIIMVNASKNNTVTGNTVTGSGISNSIDRNTGNGIMMWESSTGNTVINNNLSNNKVNLSDGVGGNVISPNNIN